ncbi:meiosis-specific coiled-coil domain-containing protein MEIOC [Pyxicephalus adspersus]|uniref:C3H1-type domain-containing protein n=1 Tax=Pyxicephalus adspersus TaxID=30357 RepID=A0AAV2ZUP7_PYXAD|nr:TPA: hypothetical protein GDO54_013267 [Pyxicephalus adspersus]
MAEVLEVEETGNTFQSSDSFFTHWGEFFASRLSAPSDEKRPLAIAQPNTRTQSEKNECEIEADLNGLVSSIVDEDKAQPSVAVRNCSSLVNPLLEINLNRTSGHQNLMPDIKQYEELAILQQGSPGVESVTSKETHKMQGLYHELPGVNQSDNWSFSVWTNTRRSHNINPRTVNKESSLSQNLMSSMLPETSKETFYTEHDRYDSPNINNTKYNQNAVHGFQEDGSLGDMSSDLTTLDAAVHPKPIQPKQHNTFVGNQSYDLPQATNRIPDSLFMPVPDQKSDFGRKTLGGGSSAFTYHRQVTQRNDVQGAHVLKSNNHLPIAKSSWPLWMNCQLQSHSANSYQTQLEMNGNLPASQKDSVSGFNSSSPWFNGNFPTYRSENPAYPFSEYSRGTNPNNSRFGIAKEECVHEAATTKSLEPFNGLHENVSSQRNCNENTGKKISQDMRMQYTSDLYSKFQAQTCNVANSKNQRLGSHNIKPQDGSKGSLSLAARSVSASLVGNMPTNVTPLSAPNFQSCFSKSVGASNYACKELGNICNFVHGDTSWQNMAPMLSSQKSSKLRNRSVAQLSLCLEECCYQFKALEEDRRKVEYILMENYPGDLMSSFNNICIPKLPSNPTRVDRLIVDQLHEQARVTTMVGKMERYCGMSFHNNISAALDSLLESIHIVQARRREEMVNTSGRQMHKRAYAQDDKDVYALAISIKNLTSANRKVRTALWCALQMALPFQSNIPDDNEPFTIIQH